MVYGLEQADDLVYQTDFWDRHQWDQFLALYKDKDLRMMIQETGKQLYSFPQFALEVYTTFYKAWGLRPVDEPLPENEWARALFAALEDNPRYNSLKKRVGGDYFLCGIAAAAFIKELANRLPEPEAPLADPNTLRKEVVLQKKQAQAKPSPGQTETAPQPSKSPTAKQEPQGQNSGKDGKDKQEPQAQKQPQSQSDQTEADQTEVDAESATGKAPQGDSQGEPSGSESGSSDGTQPGDGNESNSGAPTGESQSGQSGTGQAGDVPATGDTASSQMSGAGSGNDGSATGDTAGSQQGNGQSETEAMTPLALEPQSEGKPEASGDTSGEPMDGTESGETTGQGGGDASGDSRDKLKQQAEAALSGDRQDPKANQTQPDSPQAPIDPVRAEYIQKLIVQGKAARAKMEAFSDQVNLASDEIVSAVLSLTNQAVEEAETMMDGFAWGVGGGAVKKTGDLATKLKLHKQFMQSDRIRRICELAGRMKKEAANKMQVKSRDAKTSLEDVKTGNDLFRLVGSEYLNLYVPVLQPLFYKRYTENALLQKQLSGDDLVTEGPIVFLKDISGSTKGAANEFISALSMAFLGIAAAQRRHFRLVQFDDRRSWGDGDYPKSAVRRVDDFKPGQPDFDRLLSATEFFTGGGTNWMDPLDSALDCIKKEVNYQDADIILCTDGECAVDPEWLKKFKLQQEELGFTIFGIIVGDESAKNLASFIPQKQILRVNHSSKGDVQMSNISEAFAL